MKSRCYNPKSTHSQYYYGKGIKVCDEWINDFKAFEKWSLENGFKEGLTIDRIDSNKDYCPENCRWVDYYTQNNNLPEVHKINYKGTIITLRDISNMTGLSKKCVSTRYERGWSVDEIINTPKILKIKKGKNGKYETSRISREINK